MKIGNLELKNFFLSLLLFWDQTISVRIIVMLDMEENMGFILPDPQILHVRKLRPRDAISNLLKVTVLVGSGCHSKVP